MVALLILKSGLAVVKKSAHILIEGTPAHIDENEVRKLLVEKIATVTDVHHVHAWSLTNDINLMTLHVEINKVLHDTDVLKHIKQVIEQNFNIQHTTIQVEHLPCPDDECI